MQTSLQRRVKKQKVVDASIDAVRAYRVALRDLQRFCADECGVLYVGEGNGADVVMMDADGSMRMVAGAYSHRPTGVGNARSRLRAVMPFALAMGIVDAEIVRLGKLKEVVEIPSTMKSDDPDGLIAGSVEYAEAVFQRAMQIIGRARLLM